jgi:hypothetical protein
MVKEDSYLILPHTKFCISVYRKTLSYMIICVCIKCQVLYVSHTTILTNKLRLQ